MLNISEYSLPNSLITYKVINQKAKRAKICWKRSWNILLKFNNYVLAMFVGSWDFNTLCLCDRITRIYYLNWIIRNWPGKTMLKKQLAVFFFFSFLYVSLITNLELICKSIFANIVCTIPYTITVNGVYFQSNYV